MTDFLDAYGAATPDKAAIIQGDDQTTFAELARDANSLARALTAMGLKQGDRAVWCSPNDAKVMLFSHAARKLGIFSVPLNYRFTAGEMAHVIDNSGAKLVFVHREYLDAVSSLTLQQEPQILTFKDVEALIEANDSSPLDFDPPSLGASMTYTSGTTGSPKGAVRSGTDPMVVASLIGEFSLSPDDVHLLAGPLYHSGPAAFVGLSSILGSTIVVMEKFDPSRWVAIVNQHRITTTFAAPTQLKMILENAKPGDKIPSMKFLIVSAAPFPYALKKDWIAQFGNNHLWELYGSTELGVDTLLRPEDQLRKPGSCGKAAPGVELRILQEDGTEVPIGTAGDLWMNSTSAFDGYHEDPEKNAETTLKDDPAWRSVGDIAYVDEEGFYYICDRSIDMIITGGMNVYPAEIEAALHEHPDVSDAGVVGVPNDKWGEEVVAFVALKPDGSADAEVLIAHCRERLASYKIPKRFIFKASLPRIDSGKLLKRVLKSEATVARSQS